ncbi:MAG TPA: hypothetical protein VGG74_33675 [Kofleriaceae bacterium]|jgi:hypothetical protein
MGRWILALLAASVVVPSRAGAKEIMVRGPALTFTCPNEPSWGAVEACIKQRKWTLKIVRTVGSAKLIEINAPVNRLEGSSGETPNIAIYVQRPDKHWQLGGLFEIGLDVQYDVLDFQPLTIAHTHGFRLDVGTQQTSSITVGDVIRSTVMQLHHVLFCNGENYECSEIVPSCDALVDDKLLSSFHGQLVMTDRQVRVDGDAAFAAPACAGPQQIELGWQ